MCYTHWFSKALVFDGWEQGGLGTLGLRALHIGIFVRQSLFLPDHRSLA